MRNHPVIAVAAGLVLLGSLAALAFSVQGLPLRPDTTVPDEIGRTLAREAMRQLGSGHRLTVLMRDTTAFPQPAADRILASLTREAGRAGTGVSEVQRFEVDPLRPAQVPPGDFAELIRHSTAGDVIVSLLGPPLLDDGQRAALPANPGCRIVALCAGPFPDAAGLRQIAAQNLLHAAIVDRPAPKGVSPGPSRGRESFDQLYLVTAFPTATSGSGTAPSR